MKNVKQSKELNRLSDVLDFQFVVSSEAIEGKGEDSFCSCIAENSALIGVFDGCGGLGSRQYENYEGHTGAYIAARIASGVVYDWFLNKARGEEQDFSDVSEEIRERVIGALQLAEAKGGNTLKVRGSMVRDFPTTAAIAIAQKKAEQLTVHTLWAGDSRIYLLGRNGLNQITNDNTDSIDAFEDLRNDPVQNNVLSSDGRFTIYSRSLRIQSPVLLVACTDGYFGYWRTPMHFEHFLLDALNRAGSVDEWKKLLREEIREVTGDDATLAMTAFMFSDFETLKNSFRARYIELKKKYILRLEGSDSEEEGRTLWNEYRIEYERYLNRKG